MIFSDLSFSTSRRAWFRKTDYPSNYSRETHDIWLSLVQDYYAVQPLDQLSWQGQLIEIDLGQAPMNLHQGYVQAPVYRMWVGSEIMGVFYRKNDGNWYARSVLSEHGRICSTSRVCQLVILSDWDSKRGNSNGR